MSTDFITTVKLTGTSLKSIGLLIASVMYILTEDKIFVFNLLYNLLLGSTLKGYAREMLDVSKEYKTSVDTPPSKESFVSDVLIFMLSTEFVMFGSYDPNWDVVTLIFVNPIRSLKLLFAPVKSTLYPVDSKIYTLNLELLKLRLIPAVLLSTV